MTLAGYNATSEHRWKSSTSPTVCGASYAAIMTIMSIAGALTGVIDEDTRAPLSQMQKHNNLNVNYTGTEVLNALGIAAQ